MIVGRDDDRAAERKTVRRANRRHDPSRPSTTPAAPHARSSSRGPASRAARSRADRGARWRRSRRRGGPVRLGTPGRPSPRVRADPGGRRRARPGDCRRLAFGGPRRAGWHHVRDRADRPPTGPLFRGGFVGRRPRRAGRAGCWPARRLGTHRRDRGRRRRLVGVRRQSRRDSAEPGLADRCTLGRQQVSLPTPPPSDLGRQRGRPRRARGAHRRSAAPRRRPRPLHLKGGRRRWWAHRRRPAP